MNNQFFQDVYWIGLERRSDKAYTLDEAKKMFGEDSVIRIVAYDGTRLRLMDDALAEQQPLFSFNRGAIGCYLSHMNVYQMMVNRKRDALILEDDAKLREDFISELPHVIKPEWEHVSFIEHGEQGTWAYMLRWEAAEKLLGILQDRKYAIDIALQILDKEGEIKTDRIGGMVTHLVKEHGSNISSEGKVDIPDGLNFFPGGEDLVIEEFFNEIEGDKKFLDVGCRDARQSVTRRLALVRGWDGVFVEPDPYQWVRLNLTYSNVGNHEFVCAALAPSNELRTLTINRGKGMSTTDPSRHEKQKQQFTYQLSCHTPTVTPEDLSRRFGKFDFINLNCSGLEEQVLKCETAFRVFPSAKLIRIPAKPEVILAAKNHGFHDPIIRTERHLTLRKQ